MKTLGITIGQGSGCAVYDSNKIVFASSEERYTGIKSDEAYPFNSINDGIKFSKINPNEFDQILIAGTNITLFPVLLRQFSNFSVEEHIEMMENYWYPTLVKHEKKSMFDLFSSKISKDVYPFNTEITNQLNFKTIQHPPTLNDMEKISDFFKTAIASQLKIDKSIISHIDHHTCHAAYALYGSPIRDDNTLVITGDAWGDDLSGSISIFDKKLNKVNRVKDYSHKNFQLARIYRYVTLYLRMLPNQHEYKVMGLAPYYNGDTSKVEKVFSDMLTLDYLTFNFNNDILDIFDYLSNNLKNFRFDQIAAGIQSFTEKILVEWISNALSEYNSKNLVFSGGLSMNVKANMEISQLSQIEKFFVCGGGSDETLSLGACYHYAERKNIISKPLENLYLGPTTTYDESELDIFNKYKITHFSSVEQILEKILDNKIIATCIGRMEMGPRSLGNRSILADPRNNENVEKINRIIKNRDFWMPFAPIILHEYQDEVIYNPKNIESPYMTIAFDSVNGKDKMPAAIHRYDGTARPEILTREINPVIWNLIHKFYESTKVPALLNTSFNLHGAPVVRTIQDALHVFENSGLDVLWLDNHIIEK
jgi:carbamoyltransferase